MPDNISQLEALLADKIPVEYVEFMRSNTFDHSIDYAIDASGFNWMIDEFLFGKPNDHRLAEIYESVSHAIPESTFPIISTLGGLILLVGDSKNDKNAYYWDHERLPADDSLLKIAKGSKELLQAIVPYEDGG